jgi:hypoxanthine phosphoribosyltransferase
MLERTPAVGRILIDKTRIADRVRNLGGEISRDYEGKQPLVVGVLRGAVVFHADLIRHLELNLKIDFMSVASYGPATDSSGEVRLVKDLESSILGIDVILVEDIVDTGLTLDYLLRNLKNRRPASLRVCSLLSKPDRRSPFPLTGESVKYWKRIPAVLEGADYGPPQSRRSVASAE